MSDFPNKDFLFSIRVIPTSDTDSVLELNQTHFHNKYELYFLEKGTVDFFMGDLIYKVQPNDMVIVPPNIYHCARLQNNNLYERTVIQFSPDYFNPKLFFELNMLLPFYRISSDNALYHLINHVKNIWNTYTDAEERFTCISKTAYLILTELYKRTNSALSEIPTVQHPLSNVVQYIDENLHLPLTVNSIAQKFFFSTSYLSHNFQRYMHISLKQYINHKKILAAEQLIRSGIPVMKAAEQCGFTNYSTFYFQYKKILGNAPRPINDEQ